MVAGLLIFFFTTPAAKASLKRRAEATYSCFFEGDGGKTSARGDKPVGICRLLLSPQDLFQCGVAHTEGREPEGLRPSSQSFPLPVRSCFPGSLARASVPRTPLKSGSCWQCCIVFRTVRNMSGCFARIDQLPAGQVSPAARSLPPGAQQVVRHSLASSLVASLPWPHPASAAAGRVEAVSRG